MKLRRQQGFSLAELLIVMAVSSVLMAAALSTYMTFTESVTRESMLDSLNADVKSVFKIIEKDINLAGYGLPKETRVASHHNCSGDESFCKSGSDRLFLADGSEILKDVTSNHEDDGSIPPEYATFVANTMTGAAGGYRAQMADPTVAEGTRTMTLTSLNINAGEENTTSPPYDDDFKGNNALIVGNSSRVEGHRISTLTAALPPSVTLLSRDSFKEAYAFGGNHSVVPAVSWYLRADPDLKKYPDGTLIYWLYRNENRCLPYVDDFAVQYGYDSKNDGLQWSDAVPPANVAAAAYDDWAPTPDGTPFNFSHLKALRVSIRTRVFHKGEAVTTSYQTIVHLRN